MDFKKFPKIPRLSRECIITEKIDGTNAQIYIGKDGGFLVGSRKRWITPEDDNYGFAKWAYENKDELLKLGIGHHFGEWWGEGIQREYGLDEKRFSLFNISRWLKERPECCHVVPVLYQGIFDTTNIRFTLENLEKNGSVASIGFNNPEGIIIFHVASKYMFKKTIKKDERNKGEQ